MLCRGAQNEFGNSLELTYDPERRDTRRQADGMGQSQPAGEGPQLGCGPPETCFLIDKNPLYEGCFLAARFPQIMKFKQFKLFFPLFRIPRTNGLLL